MALKPIEILIKAAVDGMDEIKRLIAGLDDTSEEAKLLKQQADQLSAAFNNVGKQQGLIDSFVKLKQESSQAATAFDDAQRKAQELGQALAQTAAPTKTQIAEFERARKAVSDTKQTYQEITRQLDQTRSAMAEAGLSTKDLAAQQVQLHKAAQQAQTGLKDLINSTRQATEAGKQAAAEEIQVANLVAETKARLAAQAQAEADGIIADYARMEQAQREAAQAAQKAAQDSANALQNAFGTVGVRSAEAIRAEIQRVRDAMQVLSASGKMTGAELATAMKAGEQAISGLERELRQATGTMTMADKAAGLLRSSVGQISAGNLVADGIGYLTGKVKELGNEFVQSVMQGEKMRLALTAIYKDAGIAASQIKFLRDTARQSGVAYGDLSRDFIKFSATMNGANIPLKQSNELFAALTRAAGALGMSSEEVSGALNALGQMASKGVVSMEELRQQLGERLPSAMSLVAKGFGISEKALIDLVSSGQLAFRDLIGPLTGALKSMQAETHGASNAWERLKNLMKGSSQDMGDAGWAKLLTLAIQVLGTALGAVIAPIQTVWEGIRLLTVGVVALGAALTGDAKTAWELFRYELDESDKRLKNTGTAIRGLWGETDKAKASTEGQTAAMQGNNAAMSANAMAAGATATQLGTLTAAAVKSAEEVSGLERVTQLQALAIRLAGDNTLDASAKLVQFNVAASQMLAMQEKLSDAAAKKAKAVKDEGDALVGLIALRGNEQATLVAAATATENHRIAMDALAASQQAEVQILQEQMQALERDQIARNLSDQAIKAEKDALEGKLIKARSEAEQSRASADALRQEALARQVAAESYADNSAKVGEYSEALAKAKAEVAALEEHHKRGTITEEQVRVGRENLSKAQALYNDALKDSVVKQQAYGEAKKSVYALETAGLELALKQAEASENMARLMGKESEAREAARKQREIEIKLVETKVKSLQAEADAMEAVARAQQEELIAKGELTEVDQTRISNALRTAEAKRQEAAATEAGIATMKKEAEQLGASTEAYIKRAEAIKRKNDAAKADSDLTLSNLELRKSELDASIKIAEAAGDETKATKLKIEQKRIEIQIIQETVKAQIADAEASIGVAEAKMSELRATGSLTAEKRAELEAQIKGAQAKINEAKARGQAVRVIEDEIKALQGNSQGHDTNASAIDKATMALERQNAARERSIAAQEKEMQLAEREAEIKRKKLGVDKDGYSVDANGNRIQQTIDNATSLTQKGIDAGLSATQAQQLAAKYPVNQNTGEFDQNGFWKDLNELKTKAAVDSQRLADLQRKVDSGQTLSGIELEQLKLLGGNLPQLSAPPPIPTPAPPPRHAPAPAPTLAPRPAPTPPTGGQGGGMSITPAPSYTSVINLPGVGSTRAMFDNPSDQASMEDIFRALASAKGVAQ